MVRHHDRSRANIDRAFGVTSRHDALQAELPAPIGADLFGHFPVHRRVEHRIEIFGDRDRDICACVHMRLQIGQSELFAEQIIGNPAGVQSVAQYRSRCEPGWRGKTAAQTPFAVTRNNGIDRERNRIEFRRLAALDH